LFSLAFLHSFSLGVLIIFSLFLISLSCLLLFLSFSGTVLLFVLLSVTISLLLSFSFALCFSIHHHIVLSRTCCLLCLGSRSRCCMSLFAPIPFLSPVLSLCLFFFLLVQYCFSCLLSLSLRRISLSFLSTAMQLVSRPAPVDPGAQAKLFAILHLRVSLKPAKICLKAEP